MTHKGPRILLAFICSVCKRQNYISQKNKTNHPEKISLKKYCKQCRKTTLHKESSKLK